MTTNALISVSMLDVLWDKKHYDAIDLLVPLVIEAIGKTTKVGERINRNKVQEELLNQLGYDELPIGVVNIALKRISRQRTITRNHDEYVLSFSIAAEMEDFQKQRNEIKGRQEAVGAALSEYLEKHARHKERLDADVALDELIGFLERRGTIIYRDATMLAAFKRKNGELDYHIGQFILRENERQSTAFYDILAIVRGSFISAALYLQPDNSSVLSAGFRNTYVLFDAPVLLSILGFNLEEENGAAREAFDMIVRKGAKAACFSHTVSELKGILAAYKWSISRPVGDNRENNAYRTGGPTLPGLDRKRATPAVVETIIQTLESNLDNNGISIVDAPEGTELAFESVPTKDEFKQHLLEGINYSNEDAAGYDASSAYATCLLRGATRSKAIESCSHLFVTHNAGLRRIVNNATKSVYGEYVPPVMTMDDISAIVWLKMSATNPDYPKKRLLENAAVALEPDDDLLAALFDAASILEECGRISTEDARAIRARLFDARQLMEATGGNSEKLDTATVMTLVDDLRSRIETDNEQEIIDLQREISARDESIDAQNALIEEMRTSAYGKIAEAGENDRRRIIRIGRIVVMAILAIVFLGAVVFTITSALSASYGLTAISIAFILASIAGMVDSTLGKRKTLLSWVERTADRYADRKKDEMRTEMAPFLIGNAEDGNGDVDGKDL